MIRTVFFDFSSADEASAGYQFGGYEQEHGATTLQVRLPDSFLSPAIRFVHFDFQTSLGETIAGEPLHIADKTVSAVLHQQLMQAGVLQFQVIARGTEDSIIAKTPIGKLIIEKSTYGDPVVINDQPYRVDQEILNNLALAQQAAANAEQSKQELLAKFPISGDDIANEAIRLRHFSEAGYTLLRQMGLNGRGNDFLGFVNEDPDQLYRFYFVGSCLTKAPSDTPEAPAVIEVGIGSGNCYTVVGINGKPIAYKDIPLYGLYRFKGNSEVLLLDGGQPLSAGEVTADLLADGAVTASKVADGAIHSLHIIEGAVTADKLAPDAVTGTAIAENAVSSDHVAEQSITPAHTTFVTPLSRSVTSVAGNFDFSLGGSDRVAVEGGHAYLLFEQYPPAYPDCLMLTLLDADGGVLRRLPVSSLESVSVDDMVYDHGGYIHLPTDCAFMAMEIESPANTPGLSMEVHYTLCRLSETLTIPYLVVSSEQLSDEVKAAIEAGGSADLSNYYTKPETDTVIRDAMYTVVDATDSGYAPRPYMANGVYFTIVDGEACVGEIGGGTANAGWNSLSLTIPAYIRVPDGTVYKVTQIADYALVCNSLSGTYEYEEAKVYVPNTVTTFGTNCFEQYYGEQGGHLHIVYDGAKPSGYDAETTTLYNLADPFRVVDTDQKLGDIDTALDSILAIQAELIGGDAV